MSCPQGKVYVPGYCRTVGVSQKKRHQQLTKKEREEMESRLEEIKDRVRMRKEPTPMISGQTLRRAPHAFIDKLTHKLRLALFLLPIFTPGCVQRMMNSSYKKLYPSTTDRYEAIKQEFCKKHGIKNLPRVYEHAALKMCLAMP